ncbi:hypothetical protein WME99_35875 [Sorangium sp. So ce136]|uniref:hypothetical protein n=1 Tax=Sorangium sp. So ce136 TaxID=3133284 RepID=UPI003F0FE489
MRQPRFRRPAQGGRPFPPQGAVYQHQAPVDLAPVGAPSQVVAQLQQLPLTVSHNP